MAGATRTPRDHTALAGARAAGVVRAPGRLWLARGVWLVHVVIVAFIVLGWLLPWPAALWTVALGVPALQLTWRAFGDRCPLTVLEERLREPVPEPRPEDGEGPRNFVADLLSGVLGRPVSHRITNRLVHGVTWFAFSVAVFRLAFGDAAASE